MSVLRWPYLQDDINLSGGNFRERGKIFHGNPYLLPLYPDGVTGTTYFQPTWATTDAWATMGDDTVVTVADGKLVLTAGATPTTFVRANKAIAVSSKTIRVQWRSLQADLTTLEIGTSGAGTPVTKSIVGETSGIVDILTGADFSDFELIFNSNGNNDSPVYVDWIYVGDGSYDSLFLDASGNAGHASVFGCNHDGEGGLTFDGVNDYCTYTPVQKTTLTIVAKVKFISTAADMPIIQEMLTDEATPFCAVGLAAKKAVGSWRNTADATVTLTGTDDLNDGAYHTIALVHTGVAAYLYIDGVLDKTSASTSLMAETPEYGNIGADYDLTVFFAGTVYQPRIYDRALSAAEIRRIVADDRLYLPLSRYPLQDGFSEISQDGTIRSATDIGPSKTRRRFTALATYFNAAYDCDTNQKQVLDHFYRSVTRGGSLDFVYPHPEGYNVQARLLSPPQFSPSNQEYIATIALEVLP